MGTQLAHAVLPHFLLSVVVFRAFLNSISHAAGTVMISCGMCPQAGWSNLHVWLPNFICSSHESMLKAARPGSARAALPEVASQCPVNVSKRTDNIRDGSLYAGSVLHTSSKESHAVNHS